MRILILACIVFTCTCMQKPATPTSDSSNEVVITIHETHHSHHKKCACTPKRAGAIAGITTAAASILGTTVGLLVHYLK